MVEFINQYAAIIFIAGLIYLYLAGRVPPPPRPGGGRPRRPNPPPKPERPPPPKPERPPLVEFVKGSRPA